jgi:hypothetical protein
MSRVPTTTPASISAIGVPTIKNTKKTMKPAARCRPFSARSSRATQGWASEDVHAASTSAGHSGQHTYNATAHRMRVVQRRADVELRPLGMDGAKDYATMAFVQKQPTGRTAAVRQQYALQTIFSFFLGLMVLAFVGVGVNTFYPEPRIQQQDEQQLWREMETLQPKAEHGGELDADARARRDALQAQLDALRAEVERARELWARNTSIILVVLATGVMGVSLIRSDQLRVISNGLLLGGLFIMVYGTGWVIFSGQSTARFVVITFALLVTVGLGYLKFVRDRQRAASRPVADGAVSTVDAEVVADLEARVQALETWRHS